MISVREKPPLRHHYEATAPSGRRYRWAGDEPRAENIPSGGRHSSTMPGGHESFDCTLPRKPGVDYADLKRLSTIKIRNASGTVVSETRLERAPRVSGDRMSVSPSAVGWQAHLEDDKSAQVIYLDRELGNWREPSAARRQQLLAAGWNVIESGGSEQDPQTGLPCILLRHQVEATDTSYVVAESWYDAGGDEVAEVDYSYTVTGGAAGDQALKVAVADDDEATGGIFTADLYGTATGSGPFTPSAAKRWALWQFYNTAIYADDKERIAQINGVAVWGNSGIERRGTAPERGVWASDVMAHTIARWAPLLQVTDESIQPSDFVIDQLAFRDPTTAAEIVRQANRFGLRDWAVWNDRTFWSYERGARGKRWRARIAPAQLEETGPQLDRLWESVIVQYQDVDGTARTIGPPGSGADTESDLLKDSDPDNPANALGIVRRDMLSMGIGTARSAEQVGARFLAEQKLLDTSGRAQAVGYITDDRGIVHPYSSVLAGDLIGFDDASDTSYRRIVKAEHGHDTRTCSMDLDSPPEGLAALLERLGVVLVPLGL